MKRGFFAHCICYREQTYYKHILFLNEKDEIIEIVPFFNETANTIFIDGILIVVSLSFQIRLKEFVSTLKKQLEDPKIQLSQAVLENPVYKNDMSNIENQCLLYNIPEICWESERPVSSPIEINEIFRLGS